MIDEIKYLYGKFNDYYKNLHKSEKLALTIFAIDTLLYVILFLAYLISTDKFNRNFTFIPLIIFPVTSGITMFYSRTLLHGIVFLIVHSFPITVVIFILYTQNNSCPDCVYDKYITDPYIYAILYISISVLMLLQVFYTLFLYLLWKKRLWPLVHEYEYSKRKDIKEMHATYSVQFPIFHANFMIMGLWLAIYYANESIITLKSDLENGFFKYDQAYIYLTIPIDSLFLFYTLLMFKAVRDESKLMVYFVYLGNIIQAVVLYFLTTGYCYQYDLNLLNCFNFNPFYDILLWQACLGWITLSLSTWNITRCYKNFGKNVGFYIKYEPTPPEFKPGRKLVKRKCNYKSEFNFSDLSTSVV